MLQHFGRDQGAARGKIMDPFPNRKWVLPRGGQSRNALRSGLNIANANRAGRLVEGSTYSHLLALKLLRLRLVIELIGLGLSFEDIVLTGLDDSAGERVLGLGTRGSVRSWTGLCLRFVRTGRGRLILLCKSCRGHCCRQGECG